MNFIKLLVLCSIIIIFSQVEGNAQNSPVVIEPGSLTVTGSSFAIIPTDTAIINFKLSKSGTSLTDAQLKLDKEIKALNLSETYNFTIIKRNFENFKKKQATLNKTDAPVFSYECSTTLPISELASILDKLLRSESVEIQEINTRTSKDNKSLLAAYIKAFDDAKAKALIVASREKLELGKIIEINFSEEPPPSNIRAQIQGLSESNDINPTELNVYSSVRFQLNKKSIN